MKRIVLDMFINALLHDEHVQMLIFIDLAELDWWGTGGDNCVMTNRTRADPTSYSQSCFCFPSFFSSPPSCGWTNPPLSNSYISWTRLTCKALVYSNVIDLFWNLGSVSCVALTAHVLVQAAQCRSALEDLVPGPQAASLSLFIGCMELCHSNQNSPQTETLSVSFMLCVWQRFVCHMFVCWPH